MEYQSELTSLAEAVRRARVSKGLTQERLAEILHISPAHVKFIESGKRKPSIELLITLCTTLNISFDKILQGSKNNSPSPAEQLVSCFEQLLTEEEQQQLASVLQSFVDKRLK